MADGRHVENRYDVITLPPMVQFGWNSAENQTPITTKM